MNKSLENMIIGFSNVYDVFNFYFYKGSKKLAMRERNFKIITNTAQERMVEDGVVFDKALSKVTKERFIGALMTIVYTVFMLVLMFSAQKYMGDLALVVVAVMCMIFHYSVLVYAEKIKNRYDHEVDLKSYSC